MNLDPSIDKQKDRRRGGFADNRGNRRRGGNDRDRRYDDRRRSGSGVREFQRRSSGPHFPASRLMQDVNKDRR